MIPRCTIISQFSYSRTSLAPGGPEHAEIRYIITVAGVAKLLPRLAAWLDIRTSETLPGAGSWVVNDW